MSDNVNRAGDKYKTDLGEQLHAAHRKLSVAQEREWTETVTWGDVGLATVVAVCGGAAILGFYEMIGWVFG